LAIIGGYKVSSATSGQTCGVIMDVGVFPISGGYYRAVPGAMAVCMYRWSPTINRWIPYT